MRKFFIAAAVAVISLVGMSSSAQAAFQMQIISSSAGTTTITDGGFNDSNTNTGAITFVGSVGAYDIQVNTGLSKPVLGSAASPQLDLNYIVNRLTAGAAETLTIKISDTGFTTSPAPLNLFVGGTNGPGTTSAFIAGTGLNNVVFNTADASTTVPTSGTFASGGAFSGAGVFTVPANGGNPYSLTVGVTLKNDGSAGASSADAHLTPVPAPAGLVIALTGMPVLGLGAWIRRRRVVTAA